MVQQPFPLKNYNMYTNLPQQHSYPRPPDFYCLDSRPLKYVYKYLRCERNLSQQRNYHPPDASLRVAGRFYPATNLEDSKHSFVIWFYIQICTPVYGRASFEVRVYQMSVEEPRLSQQCHTHCRLLSNTCSVDERSSSLIFHIDDVHFTYRCHQLQVAKQHMFN